jgi:hypothetical protein
MNATGGVNEVDIDCIFKGQCADEGACCAVCQNNKGKRSHFKPDIVDPVPYVPWPQPWTQPWPNLPYVGDFPPWMQTRTTCTVPSPYPQWCVKGQ